jgi:hypothetical protein
LAKEKKLGYQTLLNSALREYINNHAVMWFFKYNIID